MTEQDKELLLKDLCTRLPYGVKCFNGYDKNKPLELVGLPTRDAVRIASQDEPLPPFLGITDLERTLMYLRPMSSMTEEEYRIYKDVCHHSHYNSPSEQYYSSIDFLNAHHFDYRGLIEKGLALEAPEDMYKEN